MESPSPSLAELLEGHTVLDVECFDRIYCNVYQPKLQTPGGTVYFLHDHRGNPIPSRRCSAPWGTPTARRWPRSQRTAGSR